MSPVVESLTAYGVTTWVLLVIAGILLLLIFGLGCCLYVQLQNRKKYIQGDEKSEASEPLEPAGTDARSEPGTFGGSDLFSVPPARAKSSDTLSVPAPQVRSTDTDLKSDLKLQITQDLSDSSDEDIKYPLPPPSEQSYLSDATSSAAYGADLKIHRKLDDDTDLSSMDYPIKPSRPRPPQRSRPSGAPPKYMPADDEYNPPPRLQYAPAPSARQPQRQYPGAAASNPAYRPSPIREQSPESFIDPPRPSPRPKADITSLDAPPRVMVPPQRHRSPARSLDFDQPDTAYRPRQRDLQPLDIPQHSVMPARFQETSLDDEYSPAPRSHSPGRPLQPLPLPSHTGPVKVAQPVMPPRQPPRPDGRSLAAVDTSDDEYLPAPRGQESANPLKMPTLPDYPHTVTTDQVSLNVDYYPYGSAV